MPADSQDLRDRLLQNDDEFRSLAVQHRDLETRLQELSSTPHLTDTEQLEAATLKKRKLHVKDRMEDILRRHRTVSAQPAIDTASPRQVARG